MAELAILGEEEFLLGFELAGVRRTYKVQDNPRRSLDAVLSQEDVGILVVSDAFMQRLDTHTQRELSKSTKPVVVVLSTQEEGAQLRKDIIRAIGVDLWKSE